MSSAPHARAATPALTWAALAVGVAALGAGAYAYYDTRAAQAQLETEAARRIAELATKLARTERDLADTTARLKQAEGRHADFDAKLAEREGDRAAIAEMYQELSRSVDDRLLAEVEQILVLSQQQLQLNGNVKGALVALEAADSRLQRAEKLNTSRLRRAIAQDIERLRSLPAVDVAGLAIKLDTLATAAESLPTVLAGALPGPLVQEVAPPKESKAAKLSANAKSAAAASPVVSPAALPTPLTTPATTSPINPDDSWAGRVWRDLWGELSQLVRIRDAQPNEASLLAPREVYFARQNLKLRLLSARLNLLARDEANYKADLAGASDLIGRYFDTRQKATQSVREGVRLLAGSSITISVPDINASLAEMRAARLPRERVGR
jgi:uroporphyrin-III C-methyltransferase